MGYSEVLKTIISNSGLTYKEVADKCKEIGQKIDPSYISRLTSGKIPPPSEEVSRSIAKVCGEDEEKLVLEAYLEKAPEKIIDFLNKFKISAILPMFKIMYKGQLNKEMEKEIIEQIKNAPLSDVILNIDFENQMKNIDSLFNNGTMSFDGESEKLNVNNIDSFKNIGLPVKDEGMEPIIKKGSQVNFELKDKYNDGDIVGIIPKDTENKELIVRMIIDKGNEVKLIPVNNKFETLTYERDKITIMGKVSKVINEM